MTLVLSLVALVLTGRLSVGQAAAPAPRTGLPRATPAESSLGHRGSLLAVARGPARLTVAGSEVPPGPLAPQGGGSIQGTVTDQRGGNVPGVTITVEPVSAVGPSRTAVSDKDGRFALVNLSDGAYLMTAAFPGFSKDVRRVEIVSGGTATEMVQLKVGTLREDVHVGPTRAASAAGQGPQGQASVEDLLDTAKQAADAGRIADAESAIRKALTILQAAAPQIPTPVGAVRIGGDIREPRKIYNVDPVYPKAAHDAGIQGTVIIDATVGRDGTVVDAHILKGEPQLNDAALAAVRQWLYTPTLLGGVPVEVLMTVTVRFTLQ